ncbi:hypothetical protein R5M92_13415 [Halomonas sp. Bachu 37]|uniref:hypothetical protein n=1 Tax=Halomonas kashgarensis TaxID=3084920 RepID=UPI0032168594
MFDGAITPEAQESATLHVLTLPHYSSTQAPSGLHHFLPNVREHSTETVAAQRLETWLSQATLDPTATHTLMLNAPGQGHALLSATSSKVIQAFSWIIVSTAEEALYENDVDSATLDATLTQLGYACVLEDDSAVYPTVARLYQRQPAVIERLTLSAERDAAQNEAEKLARELEESRVIARSEATKQSQDLKDAEAALATAKSEAERLARELEEVRVIARSEATKQSQALSAAEKQASERKQALEEKTQQLAERDKQLSEKDKALNAASEQLAQRTQERDAARKQNEEHKRSLEEKSQQLNEHIEQLSEKTKALEAAQKQLAERDAQLKEKAQQLAERDKQLTEQKQVNEKAQQAIKQHEHENQTLQHRQQLLQDELVKGEAQIDLIKDLLLREPGL